MTPAFSTANVPAAKIPAWLRLLLLSLLFFQTKSIAQSPLEVIRLSEFTKYKSLTLIPVLFVPKKLDLVKDYFSIKETPKPFNELIPPEKVPMKIIVRFKLINSAAIPDTVYFFPGLHYRNVLLYKIDSAKNIIPIPSVVPNLKDSVSFRQLVINPNDSITILAECYQIKTYINNIRPRIIKKDYLSTYLIQSQGTIKGEALFGYIFCGLLLMMILFSLANYVQGKSIEFLYYILYALFLDVMLFAKQYYYHRPTLRSFFMEEYLDFILQGIGICFYMAFMSRFLESRKNHPFLNKLFSAGIGFVTVSLILYSYLHFATDNYFLENLIENYITKGILLILIIIFLVYAMKNWNNFLFRYLFMGNFLFLFFSILSLLLVIDNTFFKLPGILGNSLQLYELGLLLELIFFLIGLTHKNRVELIEKVMESERLKLENERKELEKQMAVLAAHQEERERISADMHDELGSGMTTIRLMSEIAKNKMGGNVPVEIEKISASSNDLLNKMNAIIWSMNSSNDTVDNLISYIRVYAIEYLDGTSIHCKINTPDIIPPTEISGDKRRNIFLCLKETLNNALKHSRASEMKINITVNHKLIIQISDNGIGIDPEKIRQFGNGLKNIASRMKNIGGTYSIKNNNGTETILEFPL